MKAGEPPNGMATESILKKGYLYQFRNKQEVYGWERLYFVLHGHSAKNEARLDWYESLESSLSNPGLRSGIFMEEIIRVERIAYQSKMEDMYGPSAFFLFGIYTCRKEEPYVIKCTDLEMLNDWMRQLSQLLRDVRQLKRTNRKKPKVSDTVYSMHNTPESLTFAREVDIEETAAAQRQGISGRYRFVLSRQHLSLTNPADSSTALFWHYSHVRRFGYSDRTFTIEGGQRSGPGEGLFILKNCEGHALFNEVQEKIRLLRGQSSDDGQSPSSPVLGACSRDGAPPTEKEGRRDADSAENAYQELDSEDDDDDDDDNDDGDSSDDDHSTSRNKKPKIPPKNFDLGSLQVDSESSPSGKENGDRAAKTKGRQSKADKASSSSSIIQVGLFKRFASPPPPAAKGATAAGPRSKNDGSSERLPLVHCWDEDSDLNDEQMNGSPPVKSRSVRAGDISPCVDKCLAKQHPKPSEKKQFWKSPKGKEQPTDAGRGTRAAADGKSEERTDPEPPPVKPKNFRREVTANNDEELIFVPSLPSKTKPSPKEKCNPKGMKKPDKTAPAAKKPPRDAPGTPKKTVSNATKDPGRYVKVAETTADAQTLTPFGPKISEVLLHMESCQVSEPGGSSSASNISAKAPEGEYNRIDFRSEAGAAGRARTTRDADDERHLYGQSLICQMTQLSVQDESFYEDIVVDTKPKTKSKKTKK